MPNVRVTSGDTPLSARIHIGGNELLSIDGDELHSENALRPLELILAGLGGSTVADMHRCAAAKGWALDGVYAELAIHGEMPFQAIGRRIWLDADLSSQQISVLASAADASPVYRLLNSSLGISTRVLSFPRPDR